MDQSLNCSWKLQTTINLSSPKRELNNHFSFHALALSKTKSKSLKDNVQSFHDSCNFPKTNSLSHRPPPPPPPPPPHTHTPLFEPHPPSRIECFKRFYLLALLDYTPVQSKSAFQVLTTSRRFDIV